MLPALLRRCCTLGHMANFAPCQQFISLTNFRFAQLHDGFNTSSRNLSLNLHARDVRSYSRKRNIFLNPQERDDNLSSLNDLYGSRSFNDADDDDDENFIVKKSSKASIPLTPPPSAKPQNDKQSHEEEDDDGDDDDVVDVGEGDVNLPPARNVRVKTADFIKSSVNVAQCPRPIYPEFAVIGRSNVGKSSLINLLTGRNSLAMVSKTPGKTKCINHFLINKSWYLVDLPGYGYAKTSKENVLGWNKFTRDYFLERETLVNVLLLIDASIPPMDIDIACANWLGEAEVPYTLVYTKTDKRKKGVPPAHENIQAFEAKLLENWDTLPSAVATSSRSGAGKNDLLTHIARLRGLYNTSKL